MKLIDNLSEKLVDDLRVTMQRDSRVSIAAACFSVYAYEELKAQLENIDELRFLFTSPTFLQEKTAKARREFYIPRRNREKALHGSEFEIRLRNDFSQKAISRECADWIPPQGLLQIQPNRRGHPQFYDHRQRRTGDLCAGQRLYPRRLGLRARQQPVYHDQPH